MKFSLLVAFVFSSLSTVAADLVVDPSLAFNEAYPIAVEAAKKEFGDSKARIHQNAKIERFKNKAGEYGDYKVTLELNSPDSNGICDVRLRFSRSVREKDGVIHEIKVKVLGVECKKH